MDELPKQETTEQSTTSGQKEYIAVDRFVHSFCKLFGHIGTPEYGQGLTFQDYIANKLKKETLAQEQRTCTTYLTLTLNVRWEVGTL